MAHPERRQHAIDNEDYLPKVVFKNYYTERILLVHSYLTALPKLPRLQHNLVKPTERERNVFFSSIQCLFHYTAYWAIQDKEIVHRSLNF